MPYEDSSALHIPFQALVDNRSALRGAGLYGVDLGREQAVSSSPRLLGSFLDSYPHMMYEPLGQPAAAASARSPNCGGSESLDELRGGGDEEISPSDPSRSKLRRKQRHAPPKQRGPRPSACFRSTSRAQQASLAASQPGPTVGHYRPRWALQERRVHARYPPPHW